MNIRRIVSLVVFTAVSLASTADAIVYRVAQLEGPDGKRVTLCYEVHVEEEASAVKQAQDLTDLLQEIEKNSPGSVLLQYEVVELMDDALRITVFRQLMRECAPFSLIFSSDHPNPFLNGTANIMGWNTFMPSIGRQENLSSLRDSDLLANLEKLHVRNPNWSMRQAMSREKAGKCLNLLVEIICAPGALKNKECFDLGLDTSASLRASMQQVLAQARQDLSLDTTTKKEFVQEIRGCIKALSDRLDVIMNKLPAECIEGRGDMLRYQAIAQQELTLLEEIDAQGDQDSFFSELFERAWAEANLVADEVDQAQASYCIPRWFKQIKAYYDYSCPVGFASLIRLRSKSKGLGFNFGWNFGAMNQFIGYVQRVLGAPLTKFACSMADGYILCKRGLYNPVDIDCLASALGENCQDLIFVVGACHSERVRAFLEKVGYCCIFDSGYVFANGDVKKCGYLRAMLTAIIRARSLSPQTVTTTQLKPIDFAELKPQLLRK